MNRLRLPKNGSFHQIPITETTTNLVNPARGWFHLYTFFLEKPLDLDELYWSLKKEETLVQALILLSAFQTSAISDEALSRLECLLQFFQSHQKEVILRFAYDNQGQGLFAEPKTIHLVQTHIKQAGAVVRQLADTVYLIQGLFVGSWGEMHSSRYLSKEQLRQLADTMRQAVGNQIPIAVRTPLQWRLLHPQGTQPGGSDMCLFNDGMFGSETDLGTYGVRCREDAQWEEGWCREDELAFLNKMHEKLPYGGEAVGVSDEGSLERAAAEMRQAQLSYLNAVHDKSCLERWRSEVWNGIGVWNGRCGLDYIGAHLGYRLLIRSVSVRGRSRRLEIELQNTGFAGVLEEAELIVTVEAEGRQQQEQVITIFPKDLQPGRLCRVSCVLHRAYGWPYGLSGMPDQAADGRYLIYARLRRRRDKRRILLANGQQPDKVLLGIYFCSCKAAIG